MDDMLARGNMTMQDVMAVAQQMLSPLKNHFGKLPEMIPKVYTQPVEEGEIKETPEGETPQGPMDTWAKRPGTVRKPANFISSIPGDRGQELTCRGVGFSEVAGQDRGIGGLLALLWFRRQLPKACTEVIKLILMVTAGHGSAISGARNTIVAARAGKDLVSALCSGLLSIGPRFGGAPYDAAGVFGEAHDSGVSPKVFFEKMKKPTSSSWASAMLVIFSGQVLPPSFSQEFELNTLLALLVVVTAVSTCSLLKEDGEKKQKEAGFHVPAPFDKLPEMIPKVYMQLVEEGEIKEKPEGEAPQVPMDYTWAKKLGMVRKPANFISSIPDDRGEELTYCGVRISEVFGQDRVLALLRFRRQLPKACTRFIELILMVTADHGPAGSGAHTTIVTARAGKERVSALCSGILTIGPRFGDAAGMFAEAHGSGVSPRDFFERMKKTDQLIMGIGHARDLFWAMLPPSFSQEFELNIGCS